MIAYVAQQTKDKKGYTVYRMVDAGRPFPLAFHPTDCRVFQTFDEANRAAEFMASESKTVKFVNMR